MTGHSTGADPTVQDLAAQVDRAAPGTTWVIIPVLDEQARIGHLLGPLRAAGATCVVVDGGSSDGTAVAARAAGALVIDAPRGRAIQMQRGAELALARGADCLVFLHADCVLPDRAFTLIEAAIRPWGRFDVLLEIPTDTGSDRAPATAWTGRWLRLVARMMNLRSAMTGVCTGDQAIHVRADLFRAVGGFALIPLMEDIDLSVRLRRRAGWPARHRPPVRVSARRWVAMGVWRCIGQMWWLRLRYFLGADPALLHAAYYGRSAVADRVR